MMKIFWIALAIWNVAVFFLMGLDKRKAIKEKRRISEKALLLCAFIFGAVGEIVGGIVFHHKTRKTKFKVCWPLAVIVNIGLIMFAISSLMALETGGMIETKYKGAELDSYEIEELTDFEADCALVLGCGIWDEDTPSPMLKDRLDTGIMLYKSGVCPKLLLSGDNGQEGYNEIHVMLKYCRDAGVPDEDIFCDHAGFSTYDSMVRAKQVFGVDRAIVITQKYHEFRSLYIGTRNGIVTQGVASSQRRYVGAIFREAREVLARAKDYGKCLLNYPPKYGGAAIDITGSGTVSWDE